MICHGCQADLSKAMDLPLRMSGGILIVVCPLCKYQHNARTTDNGNIVLFAEEKNP